MKKVLILCTGNSCRSQMAEQIWNHLAQGRWQAVSAGSDPAGYVHELAHKAMSEIDLDMSSARSKNLTEFLGDPFDLVVTVCDNAKVSCPVFAGAKQTLHWPFDDPAHAEGSDDDKFQVFRRVRNEISARIQRFLRSEN